MISLRCEIREFIEAAMRAVLLRNGCTTCEASSVKVEPGVEHGGNVSLASVRGADGREIYRVHELSELDGLMAGNGECAFLAKQARRAAAAA